MVVINVRICLTVAYGLALWAKGLWGTGYYDEALSLCYFEVIYRSSYLSNPESVSLFSGLHCVIRSFGLLFMCVRYTHKQ